jgi:hypothetical protein
MAGDRGDGPAFQIRMMADRTVEAGVIDGGEGRTTHSVLVKSFMFVLIIKIKISGKHFFLLPVKGETPTAGGELSRPTSPRQARGRAPAVPWQEAPAGCLVGLVWVEERLRSVYQSGYGKGQAAQTPAFPKRQ